MSKPALDKFLALAERSRLVPTEALCAAVNQWKQRASASHHDDARSCADHLVDTGLLTRWQATKLLEGRHRGFFLGRYKLLDHLGSGGMSNVYLAEHTLMRRQVAVKVLPRHRVGDGSYLARFHQEGQCVAALDHPNIVRAYDLDSEADIHYLVMEYVDGQNLQAIVERFGPTDFYTAADYIAQAALGLHEAHEAGIVHRDVKPANLLVDTHGVVKILDMGLAKYTKLKTLSNDADAEQVVGTADYVAPEQTVDSDAVDHRADVYSLGCTLYFLLTGHPPFTSGTPAERIASHQREAPSNLLDDRPDTPATLARICHEMMEKSPLARCQTAAEVNAQLTAWLAEEASAGRVRWHAEAMTSRAAQHGMQRDAPRTGVASADRDEGPGPKASREAAATSSPVSDTDPNLHRPTDKISPEVIAASDLPSPPSASHSHVLHHDLLRLESGNVPPTPPDPPVARTPPSPPTFQPQSSSRQRGVAPVRAVPARSSGAPQPPVVRGRTSRSRHRAKRSSSTATWGVILLSALILAAVLLAVLALAD